MPYVGSYVWKVRQKYGSGLLLLPAAGVIPEREDGAILLIQRTDTGKWATIGGYAEEGTGFLETAVTELREEGALAAETADLIPYASLSDPKIRSTVYSNGDKVQVFSQYFIVRKWQQLQETPDRSEVLKLRFFSLDNLPENIDPVNKQEIEAYKRYLATGEFQVC